MVNADLIVPNDHVIHYLRFWIADLQHLQNDLLVFPLDFPLRLNVGENGDEVEGVLGGGVLVDLAESEQAVFVVGDLGVVVDHCKL
jgi:hypothetical protein